MWLLLIVLEKWTDLHYYTTNTTESQWSTNLVVRPDTVVYLSYLMASKYPDRGKYQSQTDKSFAISGRETNKYMSCARLVKPSISKNEIKNIIKGNAHKFLSPERRLDALLFYTKNLLD